MHTLNPEPLRRAVRALVIGCGGSGSAIASGLPYLQAMVVSGHPGRLHVTIMDGDIISFTSSAWWDVTAPTGRKTSPLFHAR